MTSAETQQIYNALMIVNGNLVKLITLLQGMNQDGIKVRTQESRS